jgi:hypothetical protein
MGIEYYFYAVLCSTGIMLGWHFLKHIWNVNIFYRKLEDLFIAYYNKYPDEDPYKFAGIVVTRFYAWTTPWEKDFNNFIQDPEMLKELYNGAGKWAEEEKARREEITLECAWCDNQDANKFLWFETDNKHKQGTIQCQECFSTCPTGTYEECIDMMAPCDCCNKES